MRRYTCSRSGTNLTVLFEREQVRDTKADSPLLKWLERLLLVGGGAVLLWCAWVVTDAYVVQRFAHQRLEAMRHERTLPPTSVKTPSSPAAETLSSPPGEASLSVIVRPLESPTAALGELSIPRLKFSAVVFQGSDNRTLRFGLGHLENTPLPGAAGNVAIAGHRDSFFRSLQDLQEGDDIWVDTVAERVHYRVSWLRVVNPAEVSVLSPTTEPVLTLVTCFPFQFIGRAPYRFIVRAISVQDRQGTE